MPRRRLLAALTVVSMLSASLPVPFIAQAAPAGPSAAEKDTARSLMKTGRAAREKGDHKAALESFKAADAIMQVPTTGVEVGREQVALGLLVEARDTFLRVTRIPVEPKEPPPIVEAREAAALEAEKLEARVPTLKLTATGVPAGTTATVTVDGVDVSSIAFIAPLKLNPGPHVLAAKAGEWKKKLDVDLKEGEAKELTLEFSSDDYKGPEKVVDKPIETPVPEKPPSSGPGALTFIGFGLGGAGIIAGSITGLMAMSKTKSAKDHCTGNLCGPEAHDDLASAKSLSTISTISFIVGGVGVGIGVVGLITGGSSKPTEPVPAAAKAHVDVYVGVGTIGLMGAF